MLYQDSMSVMSGVVLAFVSDDRVLFIVSFVVHAGGSRKRSSPGTRFLSAAFLPAIHEPAAWPLAPTDQPRFPNSILNPGTRRVPFRTGTVRSTLTVQSTLFHACGRLFRAASERERKEIPAEVVRRAGAGR